MEHRLGEVVRSSGWREAPSEIPHGAPGGSEERREPRMAEWVCEGEGADLGGFPSLRVRGHGGGLVPRSD